MYSALAIAYISIHFPRMREDPYQEQKTIHRRYFNPLPSNEGRRSTLISFILGFTFQSTSLEWGKTGKRLLSLRGSNISIHFPRMREDLHRYLPLRRSQYFNPLPSNEGRRWWCTLWNWRQENFNPLPSNEGRHKRLLGEGNARRISIHFPRMREDR